MSLYMFVCWFLIEKNYAISAIFLIMGLETDPFTADKLVQVDI
jgi:hypothetical protein